MPFCQAVISAPGCPLTEPMAFFTSASDASTWLPLLSRTTIPTRRPLLSTSAAPIPMLLPTAVGVTAAVVAAALPGVLVPAALLAAGAWGIWLAETLIG